MNIEKLQEYMKTLHDIGQFLKCSICLEITKNVSELTCRHKFCSGCLDAYRATVTDKLTCPICKIVIKKRKTLNRDSLIDAFSNLVKKIATNFQYVFGVDVFQLNTPDTFGDIIGKLENSLTSNPDLRIYRNKNDAIVPELIASTSQASSPSKVEKVFIKKEDEKKQKGIPGNMRQRELGKKLVQESSIDAFDVLIGNLGSKPIRKYKGPNKNKDKILVFENEDNKRRIIEWLEDSRNKFDRLTQSQCEVSDDGYILEAVNLPPSVSQANKVNRHFFPKAHVDKAIPVNKQLTKKRAHSLDICTQKKDTGELTRHSLTCGTQSDVNCNKVSGNVKGMLQDVGNILLVDLMEQEYLNTIDRELQQSIIEPSVEPRKDIFPQISKKRQKQKSKEPAISSPAWKSINTFKKSISKVEKLPKKLDISLQSTQKQIKKKAVVSILETNSIKPVVEDGEKMPVPMEMKPRIIDFNQMEEYFIKTLPSMMAATYSQSSLNENNPVIIDEKTKHDTSNKHEVKPIQVENIHVNTENHNMLGGNNGECTSDNSESEIYFYQTQPIIDKNGNTSVSKNKSQLSCKELVKNTVVLMTDLERLLDSEFKHSNNLNLDTLIKPIMNKLKDISKVSKKTDVVMTAQELLVISNSPIVTKNQVYEKITTGISGLSTQTSYHLEEKGIQTDEHPQKGFNISSNEAFKSQNFVNREMQTNDLFCTKCNSKFVSKIDDIANISIPNASSLPEVFAEFEFETTNEMVVPAAKHVEVDVQLAQMENENKISLIAPHEKKSKNDINTDIKIPKKKEGNLSALEKIMYPQDKNNFVPVLNEEMETSESADTFDIIPKLSTPNHCDSEIDQQNKEIESMEEMPPKIQKNINSDNKSGSVLVCSIPNLRNKVNRQLSFNNDTSDLKYKRIRMQNSDSDCEEQQRTKIPCNRFIRDDLSIEFELNTEEISNKSVHRTNTFALSQGSDINYDKYLENILNKYDDLVDERSSKYCSTQETRIKKTKNKSQEFLDHYDQLIEEASVKLKELDQPEAKKIKLSTPNAGLDNQKCHSNNFQVEKNYEIKDKFHKVPPPNSTFNNFHSKPSTSAFTRDKAQEVMKHCNDLIEEATKQLKDEPKKCSVKTQGKSQNELFSSDDFMCTDNLLKLEEDIQNFENTKKGASIPIEKDLSILDNNKLRNEFSESLFCNSTKQDINHLQLSANLCMHSESFIKSVKDQKKINMEQNTEPELQINGVQEDVFEELNDSFDSEICAKMDTVINRDDNTANKNEKTINILQNITLNGGEIPNLKNDNWISSESGEELFSDTDFIDSTPQKKIPKLSENRSSNPDQHSSPLQQFDEDLILDFVPPPPGFEDFNEMDGVGGESKIENLDEPTTEPETCNIVENSVSPDKLAVFPIRKPLVYQNLKKLDKVTQLQYELSQKFPSLSPITKEKSRNLNVIEIAQQSKFSPLTIIKQTEPSPVTSTPKQKSILNYIKPIRNSQSSLMEINMASSKPCIACTRLGKDQILSISSMSKRKLSTYSTTFGPNVTHMIVSVNEKNCVRDHTIKFVSAVAAGIWVLSFVWVQECLAKNAIVPEESYEALDVSGVPGPKMARLNRKTHPLFKGFKFHLAPPFLSTTVEEVEGVITLLGGIVVSEMKELLTKDEQTYIIITEARSTQDFEMYENWLEIYKVVTVDIEWLSRSVGQYKLLSVKPFALCSDDSLQELGYPATLLIDVPYSENTCDTPIP